MGGLVGVTLHAGACRALARRVAHLVSVCGVMALFVAQLAAQRLSS
jgi:hypothetical protein